MSRRYAYSRQEKAMESERTEGALLAGIDWDHGHRESLRIRDAVAWDALTACEKTGYGRAWRRLDFAFRQTFCVRHRNREECPYCRMDAREMPEPVELTRELVKVAESW